MASAISSLQLICHVVDAVVIVAIDEEGALGAEGLERLADFRLVRILRGNIRPSAPVC